MRVIETRNVHEALSYGMELIKSHGTLRDSRAGQVMVMDGPVTTLYQKPTERVVFWPERDANPFFHFMEGLWMIAGRNDVLWLERYSSNIAQFSDNGETFHGAYGFRWLSHWMQEVKLTEPDEEIQGSHFIEFNQIQTIIKMLRENPHERRCVLTMWDPEVDLGRKGKDVPCNTQIFLKISLHGELDMTVCNRSNDMIWGAYGANAVHFSMFQEFMAAAIGVPVGRYWQVSNDFHAYVEVFKKHEALVNKSYSHFDYPYTGGRKVHPVVEPYPMVNTDIRDWIGELYMFMDEGPVMGYRDPFFKKVAVPLYLAWDYWKNKDIPKDTRIDLAINQLDSCIATDWRLAATEWLERRRP